MRDQRSKTLVEALDELHDAWEDLKDECWGQIQRVLPRMSLGSYIEQRDAADTALKRASLYLRSTGLRVRMHRTSRRIARGKWVNRRWAS